MSDYYAEKCSAERLRRCYEVAPSRVRQYLQAEIEHSRTKIRPGDLVLELGCGYGRILTELTGSAGRIIGIDTSLSSLVSARTDLARFSNIALVQADAIRLPFASGRFDIVLCLQNGVSAFRVDPGLLFGESLRVAKSGGIILFSGYAERFWADRLAWFEIQAAAGLIGEIDDKKTGDGRIVCKDGFTAVTYGPDDFRALADWFGVAADIYEIDGSSLFCEIRRL